MNVTISWSYTPEHRYESDLDEKVDALILELCQAVPARYDGSGGGTGFGGDGFASDCSHYFRVPNMECAKQLQYHIDLVLKGYDARYEARLSFPDLNDED